jgi:ribosome-associated protein
LINSILDKKGEKVVSLDLRKIPEAVTDFFILCEASSQVQVKAIADHIEIQMKKLCDEIPYRVEGRQSAQWVLVDYVNIVVHIFQPETRKFYRLEEMWSDAVIVEHE